MPNYCEPRTSARAPVVHGSLHPRGAIHDSIPARMLSPEPLANQSRPSTVCFTCWRPACAIWNPRTCAWSSTVRSGIPVAYPVRPAICSAGRVRLLRCVLEFRSRKFTPGAADRWRRAVPHEPHLHSSNQGDANHASLIMLSHRNYRPGFLPWLPGRPSTVDRSAVLVVSSRGTRYATPPVTPARRAPSFASAVEANHRADLAAARRTERASVAPATFRSLQRL